MSIQNIDEFLDGIAAAGIGTWISVFFGLVMLAAFGFWVAVKFTPKKGSADAAAHDSVKKESIQSTGRRKEGHAVPRHPL